MHGAQIEQQNNIVNYISHATAETAVYKTNPNSYRNNYNQSSRSNSKVKNNIERG